MDYGYLNKEWIIIENKIAESLHPVKRITIKKYLIDTICSYTRDELIDSIVEEYIKKMGQEKFNAKQEKYFKNPVGSCLDYKTWLRVVFKNDIDDPTVGRISADDYNYSSQKTAVELLEKFNTYRQIISYIGKLPDGIYDNKLQYIGKGPEGFNVDIEFIDSKNISQFQIQYKIIGKELDPDMLNIINISSIYNIKKIPELEIEEFKRLVKSNFRIEYFPKHNTELHKIECTNNTDLIFKDTNNFEYKLSLYDIGFVIFEQYKDPYRCIPIAEIIRPHLERFDFSKCKDKYMDDYKAPISRARYGEPNTLKHFYDKEKKTIFFQIMGQDRSDRRHYAYIIYNIQIELPYVNRVNIIEDHISGEDFPDPIDYDNHYC
jgi:hypothetical protein